MALARSKITSQGQISVPAEVRKRLGLEPGSVLEWDEENGRIFVRRTGKSTWEDVRRAAFPEGPPKAKTPEEHKEGIREYMRRKYARH